MVRKIICTLTVVLLLLCGAAATASAATVYEGTISSTYLDIAKQIDISVGDDYVFFRSGQYDYTLVSGDFTYTDEFFTLVDGGKVYKITQVTNSGYGSSTYYSYDVSDVASYTLDTRGMLVYSNLGGFPTLGDSSDLYSFVSMFILIVFGLCALIRPIFNFVLRSRKG